MKKVNDKKILILWVLLGVQILFILYANFFLQEKNIDSDMARLYVHAIEIFENRNFSTASSGMYVFLCGVFPCLLAYFLHGLVSKDKIEISVTMQGSMM